MLNCCSRNVEPAQANPFSCRREGPIAEHISGLGAKKNLVMSPDRIRKHEWICWRIPAANYCFVLSWLQFYPHYGDGVRIKFDTNILLLKNTHNNDGWSSFYYCDVTISPSEEFWFVRDYKMNLPFSDAKSGTKYSTYIQVYPVLCAEGRTFRT
jgi:hypothetical protein